MNRRALVVALVAGCHATPRAPAPVVLDVSPAGPYRSLEAARDELRRLRHDHGIPRGGATVVIHAGVYEREHAFVLTADDSGSKDAPIVYRAAAGETVRFIGGRRLAGGAPVTSPDVLARLSPEARSAVRMIDLRSAGIADFGSARGGGLELFAGHRRLPIARWPDEGFVRIADVPSVAPVEVRGVMGDRSGRFTYADDRPARWLDEADVWLHGYWFWDWSDDREHVASIDPAHHQIVLDPPLHYYGYRKGQWYYAYNVLAELDRPGEWYLDRTHGLLYVWPVGGELVASIAEELVTVTGASYVTLQGLALEATRGTAVTVTDSDHVELVDCTIVDAGGWAVRIAGGHDCGVTRCEIGASGQGGVSLDGGDRVTLVPSHHHLVYSDLHDVGEWDRMRTPAISIAGVGQLVTGNAIHDAPHTAILFAGNNHEIARNDIHDVCREANDAGAIYAGRDWTMRGTVIRENLLHDITGFDHAGCNGILLDDMFSGTTIEANVFYRVSRAVFIGGGRDNTVTRNAFVSCGVAVHVDARGLGWAAYSLPVMRAALAAVPFASATWAARYPALASIERDDPAAPRGNVIADNIAWQGGWDEIEPAARSLVRFTGNLIGVDPGFVDPAAGDFRLRPGAAAARVGVPANPGYTSSRSASRTNRALDTR